MMKSRTLTLISRSLRDGSVPNAGLNSRLRKYKRKEKRVSATWLGKDYSKHPEEYATDANQLAASWIGLCVDLATFHGEHLSRKAADELRNLVSESVNDSLGLIDHSSPIIVGFLPGQ